ncbi:UNVERIFIED_CONTAM: hypothetical protein Sradi_1092400 [Sesamum radiatum]|uniref:Protein kinase domain-containing protein n=1 Tax=Sesamum radiatum TaxID=300843 RepID=A0AAW2VD16_SESRA
MDLYIRRRCIGYGASGEIYSGFHSDTHEPVLLREVRLHGERDGIPTNLIREISFLQEIEHQNILRNYGCSSHKQKDIKGVRAAISEQLHAYSL